MKKNTFKITSNEALINSCPFTQRRHPYNATKNAWEKAISFAQTDNIRHLGTILSKSNNFISTFETL